MMIQSQMLLLLMIIILVTGFKNFSMDIEMMVGFKPNYYWLATWLVITPAAIVVSLTEIVAFLFITSLIYTDLGFDEKRVYRQDD